MEKKKLPEVQTYTRLPIQIRAHQLVKGDRAGDVMWSGFTVGAMVLVTYKDKYGCEASTQMHAQEGDYLVWREDNRGWLTVIKKEEFEKTHERTPL